MRPHSAKMIVPRGIAEEMDRLTKGGTVESLGESGTLFDEEVHFSNGMMVVIQVCPANEESPWSQGVLYFKDDCGGFHEVNCTEVHDSLTGEYVLDDEDDEYHVTVEAGDVDETTVVQEGVEEVSDIIWTRPTHAFLDLSTRNFERRRQSRGRNGFFNAVRAFITRSGDEVWIEVESSRPGEEPPIRISLTVADAISLGKGLIEVDGIPHREG